MLKAPTKAVLVCQIESEIDTVLQLFGNCLIETKVISKRDSAAGLLISMINNMIETHAKWQNNAKSLEDEIYGHVVDSLKNTDTYHLFIDQVILNTCGLRTMVHQFLGVDKWQMHYIASNSDKGVVVIEKSIDYRIYKYHQDNKILL